MTNPETRIDRICARHDAVVLDDDGRALARKNELLCAGRHTRVVEERLSKWLDTSEPVRGAGVTKVRLKPRAKVDIREAASDLEPHARVAVNALYSGEPHYEGGPSAPPVRPSRNPRPPRSAGTVVREPSAAVLDTGISAHPWFVKRSWFDACGPSNAEIADTNLDFELDNQAGHGTFITGLLLQRVPGASVAPVRVLSSDGITDEAGLIAALTALQANGASHLDVVNLSLGGYTHDDRPSPLLSEAIHGLGSEVAVVAAAGNGASTRPFWPAALKSVIGVGALDASGDRPADFTNHGWWVDACAPGQDVTSSYLWFNGPEGNGGSHDPDLFLGYAQWSGTSFATAQVSGAIAAICAKSGTDAATAAQQLLDPSKHPYVRDLGIAVFKARRAR
ncbi:MAG: S8/S53 family peptidase [Streptosporangiales bacterium]|nr:S8/S53 family peptidase [Streptosporangiales bacterium]MBO0890089.1 S8/S53 family peptidase [Acidothermales bacterium]